MKVFTALAPVLFFVSALLGVVNAQSKGSFAVIGDTGVASMHAVVTGANKVVFVDKAERNKLKNADGSFAWSAEFDLATRKPRPLFLETDTFCSAGAFLANGSLVGTAGGSGGIAPAGYRSVRIFHPCNNDRCTWIEFASQMSTARWYNTMITLPNGKILNVGGAITGTGVNSAKVNNPTYEIFPDDLGKTPKNFQFLTDTLPFNLYPSIFILPHTANTAFVFANRDAINWNYVENRVVRRFPKIPGSPRSYPLTATAVLLPLTVAKNFSPEVLVCGGQSTNSRSSPADNTCGRIAPEGAGTWETDTFGDTRRVMPDAVLLPNAEVLFLNGAGVGIAAFPTRSGQFGASQPVRTALMYSPNSAKAKRWAKMATSNINRMYHSVATLIPDGRVLVAGSNPQDHVATTGAFPTEYRAELYTPPYFSLKTAQPSITRLDSFSSVNKTPYTVRYNKALKITVTVNDAAPSFTVAIMNPGFVTHSTNMNQRYTQLRVSSTTKVGNTFEVACTLPQNGQFHPPGPSYIFVVNKDRPSGGAHVLLQP